MHGARGLRQRLVWRRGPAPPARQFPLTREGALLISLVTLDIALVSKSGYISDTSIVALGATVSLLIFARSLPSGQPPPWVWAVAVAGAAASILVNQIAGWPQGWPVAIFFLGGVLAAGLVLIGRDKLALTVAGVGMLCFLSICWRWDPSQIDVLYGLRSAGHALLAGHNPYLGTHPTTTLGAPKRVHFTYGPAVAALAALGLLFGDPRVISAVSAALLALALYCLARRDPSRLRMPLTLAAAPMIVAMIITGWPELLAVTGIAWWLVLRPRHRRASVLALFAACACGIVTIGPVMLYLVLRSRRMLAETVVAVVAAGVTILAAALWTGIGHFWYYWVGIHLTRHVGVGSLSLDGMLTLLGKQALPGFLGVAVTVVLALWFLRHPTPGLGGALADAALLTVVAMIFAKFAFFNYYFVATFAVWAAAAAADSPLDSHSLAKTPPLPDSL
jgi:hypothetical protein